MDSTQRPYSSSPLLLAYFLLLLILHAISAAATDTIHTSQSITDGETLLSSGGGMFELGFFSPGNSTNRYLGIWYRNIPDQTVVWVANRQSPLRNNSGVLIITVSGNLAILDDTNGTIIWSSNATRVLENPAAQLLETGNLVVKDADDDDSPENFIWQSFDYPADTYLPGMMSIGWNLITGVETYLSSWRSNDDPAPGDYTAHLDPTGYPQMITKRGKDIMYRIGPWNGEEFSGTPSGKIVHQKLVMNKSMVKYGDDIVDRSVVNRFVLRWDGALLRQILNNRTKSWTTYANMPTDNCDNYNSCSAYGSCNIGNSLRCGCLSKFVPRDPESWIGADWSNGCIRRIPLNCSSDVFLKYSGIKLPDAQNSSIDEQRTSLKECQDECSRKCTCMAYTQLNTSGCLFYNGDLIDIRTEPSGGQDLYIRMAYAEREIDADSKGRVKLIASCTSVAGIVLVCAVLVLIYIKTRKRSKGFAVTIGENHSEEQAQLPFYNFSTILKATDRFSIVNKIGEGGFGPVYKGKQEDGQEIVVKRLSQTSSQGVDELKNEVILIAKLQHRNLVRLLGCCVQGNENMLIYEYMPNNSLDSVLFDQTKCMLLDWERRFHIINGIAKGLLYLHQDSRLRITHQDLKASNVLLDADLNPKISNFGLARSFGGNETEAKTHRVVGTYGYMSPEYAVDGLFSIKSDVFSFGILVLEVVSGKRNRGFSLNDYNVNLLDYAWTLYKEDKTRELVDDYLGEPFDLSQVLCSIHVGLLCVQDCPEDRPSMSSVVFMLGNEVELPEPKQPCFFTYVADFIQRSNGLADSHNQVTTTLPLGR